MRLGRTQRLARSKDERHVFPVESGGLNHSSEALHTQGVLALVPRHVVTRHPSSAARGHVHPQVSAPRARQHQLQRLGWRGGAHLQIFKVLTGLVQFQLQGPNVADQVHPPQGQFPVLLGQIVAHFLHVVHQQDFSASADAAVVFQEHTFLVKRLQQGLLQLEGQRPPLYVPACSTQGVFHVRQDLQLRHRDQLESPGKFNLRAGHVDVVRQVGQRHPQFFALPSNRGSKRHHGTNFMACHCIQEPRLRALRPRRARTHPQPRPSQNPCAQARRVRNHAVQFGLKIQRVLRGIGANQGAHTTVSVTPEYAANHPKPPSTVVEADVGNANGLPWLATLFSKSRSTSKTS